MKKPMLRQNELDPKQAYLLAAKLIVISRFPRNEEAIAPVADWLIELCKGAEIDDVAWTPLEQATWLIDTAVNEFRNWDEGQGLSGVRGLFLRKFSPPPALVEYETLPAPEIECTACNDQGTVERDDRIHWCACEQARVLREEAPNLVNKMNRPRERKAADEQRRREIKATIARKLAERRRHAETDRSAPGAMPLVRRPRLFAVLGNWAGRILRGAPSR